MEIRTIETIDISALKKLYQDAGWHVYLKNDESFKTMFERSYIVYGAYDDNKLVGIIRSISDGAHILYIQDLIVLKAYQRQGIGKALLNHMVNRNVTIRQKVLITDFDDKKANAFYQASGFKKSELNAVQCYVRFD